MRTIYSYSLTLLLSYSLTLLLSYSYSLNRLWSPKPLKGNDIPFKARRRLTFLHLRLFEDCRRLCYDQVNPMVDVW